MTREGFVPWPKEAADRYREAGLLAWAGRSARTCTNGPRPTATPWPSWTATTRLTYRQLADRADGLACRLLDSWSPPR